MSNSLQRHTSFDTLAYANKLKHAGFTDQQAEAQSEALADIFDYQAATKKDLQETEYRLESKILKWMVGVSFTQATLIIGILKFFH